MAAGNRRRQRDFGRLRIGQQGLAKPAMAAHPFAPLFAQGGVGEQVIGQADLTDIEQRRRDLQTLAKGLIAAHGMRQQGRHHPHAQHLARGAARAVLGQQGQAEQGVGLRPRQFAHPAFMPLLEGAQVGHHPVHLAVCRLALALQHPQALLQAGQLQQGGGCCSRLIAQGHFDIFRFFHRVDTVSRHLRCPFKTIGANRLANKPRVPSDQHDSGAMRDDETTGGHHVRHGRRPFGPAGNRRCRSAPAG